MPDKVLVIGKDRARPLPKKLVTIEEVLAELGAVKERLRHVEEQQVRIKEADLRG